MTGASGAAGSRGAHASAASGYLPGIDALRLFSMLLVVVLHTLGHGGVLEAATDGGYRAAWLTESFAYVAVDCFALITGFVGYRDDPRPLRLSRLVELWLQVAFWGVAIALLGRALGWPVTRLDVITACLPVTYCEYWYFSAYFIVFLCSPAIYLVVRHASPRALRLGVAGCVLGLGLLGSVGPIDQFSLDAGHSAIWLAACCFVGAAARRLGVCERASAGACVAAIVALTLATWGWALFADQGVTDWFGRVWDQDVLVSYCSPTVFLAACAWLALFVRMRAGAAATRVLRLLAPAAFGVYLVSDNPLVRANVVSGSFAWIAALPAAAVPFATLGVACLAFAACLVLDKLRALAASAIGVRRFAGAAERSVRRLVGWVGHE